MTSTTLDFIGTSSDEDEEYARRALFAEVGRRLLLHRGSAKMTGDGG
jgi:hypothetical protein